MKKDFIKIGVIIFIVSLMIPIGTFFVSSELSFLFLVAVLLVITPISFIITGYICARHYKKIITWFVPLLCSVFWLMTNYNPSTEGYIFYIGFYLAICYFSMIVSILMNVIKDKIKG